MYSSKLSVLGRGGADKIAHEPFPHLVIRQALPDDTYSMLVANFPATELILRGRPLERSNSAARLPFMLARESDDVSPEWQAFFAYHVSQDFWHDIVKVYGNVIRTRHPGIEQKVGRPLEQWRAAPRGESVQIGSEIDVDLDCQFVVNTPVKRVSPVRTAHVDEADTLFSGLFYLRDPEDTVSGGDLEFGRWRRRRPRFLEGRMILPSDVEITETVGYGPNVFACFINGPASIHAVSPRSPTPLVRRYINLIAKVGFDLFETPPIGPIARRLHAREIRRVDDRRLAGDRVRELAPYLSRR